MTAPRATVRNVPAPTDLTCPFGVEEEFFVADSATGTAIPVVPPGLMSRWREQLGARVSTELLQGQIEVSTDVCRSASDARVALTGLRRELSREAARFGLGLIAAGTHPLGEWRTQHQTETTRYARMFEDFGLVAQRSFVCGLHVHVAIPDGVDRIRVMNRVTPWLPLLLALSTSSPFWNGERTGLMSYRQSAYDEWPRSGLPDYFVDEGEYDAYLRELITAGAIENAKSIWWVVRPSPSFPTLEFRIADACTDVEHAVCLSQICRCLVRAAVVAEGEEAPWTASRRLLIEENRWRAKRYGTEATFVATNRPPRLVMTLVEDLIGMLMPHAQALDCVDELLHARKIVDEGTSAHAQLMCFDEAIAAGATGDEAIHAVVRDLLHRTVARAGAVAGAA